MSDGQEAMIYTAIAVGLVVYGIYSKNLWFLYGAFIMALISYIWIQKCRK